MQEELQKLVGELADYRTRKRAVESIVAMGKEAVEPAITLLASRSEGVLWSAIQVLARLGDERAVAPLVDVLERGEEPEATSMALTALTGQDFGADVGKWRAYLRGKGASVTPVQPAVGAPPERALDLTDEEIIKGICQGTTIGHFFETDSWNLDAPLPSGRHQRVKVLFGAKDNEGAPIVVVYTECGPAVRERWEWALRKNLTLRYGAIAIRTVKNRPVFVMVQTLLRQTLSLAELKKSVMALAEKGDAIERMVTLEDTR